MGIDRKKFMTLAFSMWSGAAVVGCGPPPPAAGPPPPVKESPMQADPSGTRPTQQEQCVEFSPAGECVEWDQPAEPTGECVDWNAADECIEWSEGGDDDGPTDECMEWDSTDECIRWAGPAEECVEWDATDECIRWE